MEKGRTQQIINRLQSIVENGQNMPRGKVMIPKDEVISMLQELEHVMDYELRKHREITDKQGKIINAAKREAEDILAEAREQADRLRNNYRSVAIRSVQEEELTPEKKKVLKHADDLYVASVLYTDEMLAEVDDLVLQAKQSIQKEYERSMKELEQKSNTIAKNRKELVSEFKELQKEERYRKLYEITEVLASELYRERQEELAERELKSSQMEMKFDEVDDTVSVSVVDNI